MPIQTSVLHLCSMKIVTCLSSGVDGMISKLRGGRYGIRIPAGIQDFSFLQNVQKVLEVHPTVCSMNAGVLWRGVNRLGRVVDH